MKWNYVVPVKLTGSDRVMMAMSCFTSSDNAGMTIVFHSTVWRRTVTSWIPKVMLKMSFILIPSWVTQCVAVRTWIPLIRDPPQMDDNWPSPRRLITWKWTIQGNSLAIASFPPAILELNFVRPHFKFGAANNSIICCVLIQWMM